MNPREQLRDRDEQVDQANRDARDEVLADRARHDWEDAHRAVADDGLPGWGDW